MNLFSLETTLLLMSIALDGDGTQNHGVRRQFINRVLSALSSGALPYKDLSF